MTTNGSKRDLTPGPVTTTKHAEPVRGHPSASFTMSHIETVIQKKQGAKDDNIKPLITDEECNLDIEEANVEERKLKEIISARSTPIKSNALARKNSCSR